MNGDFLRAKPAQTSKTNLKENDRFSQGFHCTINYWEMKPTQYEAKLQELSMRGVKTVSVFVPWAHLETDIHHGFRKFLKTVHDVGLKVRVLVMPAAGVSYPNVGIPKELISNHACHAVDQNGQVIHNRVAPNIFPLPSFSSAEVLKAFGNYLLKLSSILLEFDRETKNSGFIEVGVSNGLLPYYRNPGAARDLHGDYSAANVMAFREFLDREYKSSSSENSSDFDKFKTKFYEGYNQHRFFSHVEKLLREKTEMMFTRKSSSIKLRHLDLLNPEAEPSNSNASLLTEVMGYHPSVQRFYEEILDAQKRGEAIHFSGSGIFRKFTDSQKSFLLMAAFIHCAEVYISADDLFRLSTVIYRKREAFLTLFESLHLQNDVRVSYYSADRYSMDDGAFKLFEKLVPSMIQVQSVLDPSRRYSERLLFADPLTVIRLLELVQLLSIAQSGKTVAIPAPMLDISNYTPDAAAHLHRFLNSSKSIKMNLGLSYEVLDYGLGYIVLYDPKTFWQKNPESNTSQLTFLRALLGLAEIENPAYVADSRVKCATFVSEDDLNLKMICLMNPTDEKIDTKIHFSHEMIIDSLTPNVEHVVGKSFDISVAPLAIVPMKIYLAGQSETVTENTTIDTRGEHHGIET